MNLFKVTFKYIENGGVDTIAYAKACRAIETSLSANPIVAVGKDDKEVHSKTLAFVQSNTSFKIRPESFRVTINPIQSHSSGFIDTGRISTTGASIWDADLK